MLPVAFSVVAATVGYRYLANSLLFQRRPLTEWDPVEYPIQFKNGISYIYDTPEADTVVIFSHGSGGNLTDKNHIRDFFRDLNVGFIIYDYYGYGASQDVPTLFMSPEALSKAIMELYEMVKDKRIILVGISLGSYPSSWLASNVPIEKLILCVPFDRLSTIHKLSSYMVGDYNNLELAKKITVPTLLIQADSDELIPPICANNLKRALGDNCQFETIQANHKTYWNEQTRLLIADFLNN